MHVCLDIFRVFSILVKLQKLEEETAFCAFKCLRAIRKPLLVHNLAVENIYFFFTIFEASFSKYEKIRYWFLPKLDLSDIKFQRGSIVLVCQRQRMSQINFLSSYINFIQKCLAPNFFEVLNFLRNNLKLFVRSNIVRTIRKLPPVNNKTVGKILFWSFFFKVGTKK